MAEQPCPQSGCSAASTGKCLEGLALEECPHWRKRAVPAAPKRAKPEEGIALRDAEALSAAETATVMGRWPARLVVFVGDVESGKTTLLATVFELFGAGAAREHRFARSVTLHGFERRCFEARITSGREQPATRRTDADDEPRFLHLGVRKTANQLIDLLFTDISGEHFAELRDRPSESALLPIVKRADAVVVTLDGLMLSDPTKRHACVARSTHLIRSLGEVGALRRATGVQVVITKHDLVDVGQANADDVMFRFSKVLPITNAPTLGLHSTAARNGRGLTWGNGVEALISTWTSEFPATDQRLPQHLQSSRAFLRYGAWEARPHD
ncbi:MAG: hypothetical protein AB2A00_27140 [Myxococcota bacterium]